MIIVQAIEVLESNILRRKPVEHDDCDATLRARAGGENKFSLIDSASFNS